MTTQSRSTPLVSPSPSRRVSPRPAAAKRLDLRNAWLNPPDLVRIEPEVVPGYPDRILPKNAEAAAKPRERTLTNLYNRRPHGLPKRTATSMPRLPPPMAGRLIFPKEGALGKL